MDDGGRGVRAGCIRIRCPSPRRIVSRWFSPQGKDKWKKKKMQIEEGRVRACEAVRIRSSSDDNHGVGDDTTPRIIDSDLQRREFLFSIGVSCYLLHLIDTGREEIHKIVQLRNELEKFLECRNEELRRNQQGFVELRNNIERFLEFDNDELRQNQQNFHLGKQAQSVPSAYSTTSDVLDGPESSTDQYYSPQIPDRSVSVGIEGSLHDGFGGEMDQLEAELEAEFELLQIGQDQDGKFSKHDDGSERSEDSEPMEEQQGVCPYELEKRLHELMETRQREEIKELEIALEDAKQKLHLKKTEALWWKDTAYIVSERIPESSRITYNSQTYPYPVYR